ncbi:acetyltransferase [Algoriphagus hitonicola]|uniref:Sugar O-acyltransferase, sialic acid O-acetyltransferase NeuD family n=1 Tax=Algoriphagus hitonicola TaxID=435880 RepID=A0A1I2XR26_9BACT|nr:acetyltransferase [Algoriphagus hitonicola]SFH15968.1 sugar O-acyltransferase, sialic acid O-acetyltransferase NeuD family [Algoriphagus hitonicola]
MLIIGAGGFAKEVLQICHDNEELENLTFYDDVNPYIGEMLFNKFPIIKNLDQAKAYLETKDNRFALGLGKPDLRKLLYERFLELGGILTSTISPAATIGNYGTKLGDGCNILSGSVISNSVSIGKGCLVYFNSVITHDCSLGDFVEVSPLVKFLGRVTIKNYCQIGAGSTILPDVIIGENVIIGAGSVVTKDIPDNSLAVGIPAKVVKKLEPFDISI